MNYGNKSAFSLRYHYSKYARIKRISQGTDSTEEDFHDIYEEASAIATGVLGSMQTLAGTANCKGVQIHNLAEWAKKNANILRHLCEKQKSVLIREIRGKENKTRQASQRGEDAMMMIM